jgi:hypothetical protein
VFASEKLRSIAAAFAAAILWTLLALWILFLWNYQREYRKLTVFGHLRASAPAPYYEPPAKVDFRDERHVTWIRWSAAEQDSRWSAGKDVGMLFRLSANAARSVHALEFTAMRTAGPNPVTVLIDDRPIAHAVLNGPGRFRFEIPPGTLTAGVNDIELQLPQAHRPQSGDGRVLGVALSDFELEMGPR